MGKDKGGRGKGNSGRSAGRKLFIANEDELMLRNREVNEVNVARMRRRAGSDADDDDNADEEEDEEDEGEEDGEGVKEKSSEEAATVFGFQRMSRAEAAAANKLKGGAADDDDEEEEEEDQPRGLLAGVVSKVNNPNRQPKPQEKMLKVKDLSITGDVVVNPEAGMSRKEREAYAAQKAKEDYLKRHMAGETEQARKDLERLAIVRKRREEAAQKRAAEGRPAGWTPTGIQSSDSDSDGDDDSDDDAATVNQKGPPKTKGPVKGPAPSSSATTSSSSAPVNKQAAAIQAEEKALAIAVAAKKKAAALGEGESAAEVASDGGPPKLKSMDIKKMNGDQLKDHLKARKLDVQGQKKDLMKRLIDYEAARP